MTDKHYSQRQQTGRMLPALSAFFVVAAALILAAMFMLTTTTAATSALLPPNATGQHDRNQKR